MTADVRMKGFTRRSPVDEAQAVLRARVSPIGPERVPFARALGRILAEDVVAEKNVPPHPKSAMDGYAVRSGDLPGTLRVVGQAMAADRWDGRLAAGEALKIMTGARIPDGADAVVMVEQTRLEPGGDRVAIEARIEARANILDTGDDLRAGETILPARRRLRPQDVSMLVSLGALDVVVVRKPRVRIVPTGSELVRIGTPDPGVRVVESNSFLLESLALRDGAAPVLHPIVRDDPAALRAAILEPGADLIVMTGGSSVGQEDLGPVVLREIGELPIHGIHVRPASPTGIGFSGKTPVVIAPGYPVAAFVAWDLFARLAVQRMLGVREHLPYASVRARLAHGFKKPAGRVEIMRAVLDGDRATLLKGGAALLSTTTRADGFIVFDAAATEAAEGSDVEVFLYT